MFLIYLPIEAQVFTIGFDDDICGGNGCDLQSSLLESGCVFMDNSNIRIQSLGGANKLTNEGCLTWLTSETDWKPLTFMAYGQDRKLIFHRNAYLRRDAVTSEPLFYAAGIFVDIPMNAIPKNYFYQIDFEMYQLSDWGCTRVLEEMPPFFDEAPVAPTINVYARPMIDNSVPEYQDNNEFNNQALRNSTDFLGLFTTHGMPIGVYDSPVFTFEAIFEPESESHVQIALFNDSNDNGICDDPPPGSNNNNGSQSPSVPPYGGALVDNIQIDCDQKNIVFTTDIRLLDLDELMSCDQMLYRVDLSTDCPNVNLNNFPFQLTIKNSQQQIVHYASSAIAGYTFSMDLLPTDTYTAYINYNTSNGYNIKVAQYGFEPIVTFEHEYDAVFDIWEDVTYTDPIFVPVDIVIHEGATLTVLNYAFFDDGIKVNILDGGRLVVSNSGHLTKCYNQWEGVIVNGAGRSEIINGGTISYAKCGILGKGDGASEIICNNAHFLDNQVGVKAYDLSVPIFENSSFIGGNQGVYLEGVTGGTLASGVYFAGNNFSYQNDEGILSWYTVIRVEDGNTFNGCRDGIAVRGLLGQNQEAFIGSDQASNTFYNCQSGIYSNDSNISCTRNNFFSNSYGTYMSGVGQIFSTFNIYNGGHGEAIYGIGINTSFSEHNEYNCNEGIFAWDNNEGYNFMANCFSTNWYDVNAVGTINNTQGSENIAASNCFTGGAVPDLMLNTSPVVDYYLPKETVSYPACLEPKTMGSYLVLPYSNTENSGNCGNGATIQPNEYSYIKAMGCDSTRLFQLMVSLRQQIAALSAIKKTRPLTPGERLLFSTYQRHLRYAVNQWSWCLRTNKSFGRLYNFYKEQEAEKEYALKAAEAKIMMGDFIGASEEVRQIEMTYGGEGAIYRAMEYTIDYLQSGGVASNITAEKLNTLRQVAAMSDPYAGYGRALLYKVAGERIEPIVESDIGNRNRLDITHSDSEEYTISPNPASDRLRSTITHYRSTDTYTYTLQGINDNIMAGRGYLQADTQIDISHLKRGMYIYTVLKNDIPVYMDKIIVIR